MRLAVYHNLPSGGAKRTLYEAVRRLVKRHEVDVYTLTTADHEFADLRPHVANHHVYDFRPFRMYGSPWGRLNQISRFLTLQRIKALMSEVAVDVNEGSYDAVLVEPCQFEIASSLLSTLSHDDSVYFCQEPLRRLYEPMPSRPYDTGRSNLRSIVDRLDPLPAVYLSTLKRRDLENTRQANRVLVNSRFVRASVSRIYDLDATVCYHGVDVEQFAPDGTCSEHFVLSVGSLTPLKGMDFLVRALAHIPEDHRPALVVASNFQNPPEKQYVAELAGSLGVRIRLICDVSDAQLVELYNRAAMTVYAPIREPFGLVPLESMSCGTPVVGVREGGIPETVVDGQTGLLVERDEQAFADAVQRLLADKALRREYGRNGRSHVVENWTWDRSVAQLERILFPSL